MVALAPMVIPVECPLPECGAVIPCTLNVEMEPAGAGYLSASFHVKGDTDAALSDMYLHIFAEHPEVEMPHG